MSELIFALFIAARDATLPNSIELSVENEERKEAIGVRTAETMKTS